MIDTATKFGELGKVGGPWRDVVKEVRDNLTDPELKRVLDLMLQVTGAMAAKPNLSSSISDYFGAHPEAIPGRRSAGGPVSAGSPYIVGERGRELFVPAASGTIVPTGGKYGSHMSIVQNNQFVGGDVPTVTQLDAQNRKLGIRVALSGRSG